MLTIVCASQIDMSANTLTNYGRDMTGIKALADGISVSRWIPAAGDRSFSPFSECFPHFYCFLVAD